MSDGSKRNGRPPAEKPSNCNGDSCSPDSVPRGPQLRGALSAISRRVAHLKTAMTSLPYVTEDGSSECPEAENLYAEKEYLEAQVRSDVQMLNLYMVALGKEIQRCQKNLQRLQADQARLNRQEPSEYYSEAIEAQQRQLRGAVQDRDAVYIVLAEAKAVLKVSQTRKFPGKEPQWRPISPRTPSGPSKSSSSPSSAGKSSNELEGLLSLGPLGQAKGR